MLKTSRKIPYLSAIVAACLMSTSLHALTLNEGVDEVLSTNPIIQERLYNYKATLQDVKITEAQYLPSLDYKGNFAREITSKGTNLGDLTLTSYEHSLQLTQNLFNGFGTMYEADYQKARLLAAANHYIENTNDVAYNLINLYINVLKARDLLVIAKESVSFHEDVYDKVKKLYDSGSTTRSESEKIDTSLSLARSNYIVAQNNLDDALFNFERVFGRYVPVTEFQSIGFTGIIPRSYEEMREFAQTHNPSILVSKYNIKAAEAQHQASYKNYYPKIDAYVRQSWANNINGVEGKDDSRSIGISISYNLYRGGADEAQIEKNLAQIMREKETKKDTVRKLDEQSRLSWSARTYITQQLDYLHRYAKTSSKTLELYKQEYDLGRRTLLDLLVAQNDHVSARSQIIRAENDLLFSNYRILDAMGTMVQYVLGSKTSHYANQVGLSALENYQTKATPEVVQTRTEDVQLPTIIKNVDATEQKIIDFVTSWAKAWSSKDIRSYLSKYSKAFVPTQGRTYSAWLQDRKNKILTKSYINVEISNIKVMPRESNYDVHFNQKYTSSNYNDTVQKTLVLIKEEEEFKIISETTK